MIPQPPKALLLDLDDTILDDSGDVEDCWQRATVSYAPLLETTEPGEVYAAIKRARSWFWSDVERHRVGRLDLAAARREIVGLALAALGSSDQIAAAHIADAYTRSRDARMRLLPGALDTVRWLRGIGCRLALLTNGSAAVQRGKVTRFALEQHFDAVLIEGELGFGKPDNRVYELALRRLDVKAAEAWMVGDILEWDVTPAQRLGMTGVWIDLENSGVPDGVELPPDFVVSGLAEVRGIVEDILRIEEGRARHAG